MSWQRHFLALRPDEAARAKLVDVELPLEARPTHPADLHLTLAFLGTLDQATSSRAAAAASEVAVAWPPPTPTLDRLEHWRRSRVLCVVGTDAAGPLIDLAHALSTALAARGLPTQSRPFRPHLTLARLPARAVAATGPLATPIAWRASEILLMASRADDALRPRYDILHRASFTAIFSPPSP